MSSTDMCVNLHAKHSVMLQFYRMLLIFRSFAILLILFSHLDSLYCYSFLIYFPSPSPQDDQHLPEENLISPYKNECEARLRWSIKF